MLKTLRQPFQLFPIVFFPLILLAVNATGLRAATRLPGFPTNSYISFAIAVAFVQGAMFSLINTGTNLAEDIETDRVFVHDLIMPCSIGAYEFERGKTQDVRFNIDVGVARARMRSDDMRDRHGAPRTRTRNDTGRTIPGSSAEGARRAPSATPGRTASQALKSSSMVRRPPQRTHDGA